MKRIVAIIGPSSPDPGARSRASVAGRLVAEAGFVLATGGMGGCMAAASRGAKSGGGTVLAILPGRDPGRTTQHVDMVLATGFGYLRNMLLVNISTGIVCVGMSPGTLTEASWALREAKPIFGFMPPWPGLEMQFSEDPEALANFLRELKGR